MVFGHYFFVFLVLFFIFYSILSLEFCVLGCGFRVKGSGVSVKGHASMPCCYQQSAPDQPTYTRSLDQVSDLLRVQDCPTQLSAGSRHSAARGLAYAPRDHERDFALSTMLVE